MEHYTLRRETPQDYRAVEELTREAFWNVYRPGCTEHFVLHQFRDRAAFIPELDLVMEVDGRLAGHVMYVHSAIRTDEGREVSIMTFGPISIAPQFQRRGLGSALVKESLDRARALGAGAVAITGNPDFYGKCGFVPGKRLGVRYAEDPEADYFLICELQPGFLDGITGTFRDPEGYLVDDAAAEAFDATFPPKEKLKLPGQLV